MPQEGGTFGYALGFNNTDRCLLPSENADNVPTSLPLFYMPSVVLQKPAHLFSSIRTPVRPVRRDDFLIQLVLLYMTQIGRRLRCMIRRVRSW